MCINRYMSFFIITLAPVFVYVPYDYKTSFRGLAPGQLGWRHSRNRIYGLSRRKARIFALAMQIHGYARICAHFSRMRCECVHMRAFPCIRCECSHMLAFRMRCECSHMFEFSRMWCECSHMRAFPRMRCDAMRMRACGAMRMLASRGELMRVRYWRMDPWGPGIGHPSLGSSYLVVVWYVMSLVYLNWALWMRCHG